MEEKNEEMRKNEKWKEQDRMKYENKDRKYKEESMEKESYCRTKEMDNIWVNLVQERVLSITDGRRLGQGCFARTLIFFPPLPFNIYVVYHFSLQ